MKTITLFAPVIALTIASSEERIFLSVGLSPFKVTSSLVEEQKVMFSIFSFRPVWCKCIVCNVSVYCKTCCRSNFINLLIKKRRRSRAQFTSHIIGSKFGFADIFLGQHVYIYTYIHYFIAIPGPWWDSSNQSDFASAKQWLPGLHKWWLQTSGMSGRCNPSLHPNQAFQQFCEEC